MSEHRDAMQNQQQLKASEETAEVFLKRNLETVEIGGVARAKLKDSVHAQQNKNVQHFFGNEALPRSIQERGSAFIEAAKVMVVNRYPNPQPMGTQVLSAYQNQETLSKLNKLGEHWKGFQTTETNLTHLMVQLRDIIAPAVFNNKASDAKILKELSRAENHVNWTRRPNLKSIIPLNEDTIQVRIDKPITQFTEAQQAEWLRILEKEPAKQPKWFSDSSPWEQNYLRNRVQDWQKQQEQLMGIRNLGDFLGVPPTTIRAYPGARNGYEASFATFSRNPTTGQFDTPPLTIRKIRSGHIAPSVMKNIADRDTAVKDNLKQLILAGVQDKIERGETNVLVDLQTLITPPAPEDAQMDSARLAAVSALRDEFQGEGFNKFLKDNGVYCPAGSKTPSMTLISSNYPVNQLRSVGNLLAPLAFIAEPFIVIGKFFKSLASDDKRITFFGVGRSLPIENLGKGSKFFVKLLSTLLVIPDAVVGLFRNLYDTAKRSYENYNSLRELKKKAAAIDPKDPKTTTEQRMAIAALRKIDNISGFSRIRNFFYRGINHNAERAALEQIAVAGLGGVRIGSCMSGKDREGAVSEHVAAQTSFYAKYGHLPPIPPSDKPAVGLPAQAREEYEQMVAKQFLSGHDQDIAAANASGASGLKGAKSILGKKIMQAAKTELNTKYGIDCDPGQLSNDIAHLNRLGLEVTQSKTGNKAKFNAALKPDAAQTAQASTEPLQAHLILNQAQLDSKYKSDMTQAFEPQATPEKPNLDQRPVEASAGAEQEKKLTEELDGEQGLHNPTPKY